MGRKALQGLSVLWGTLTLVFLLFAMAPDPARQLAGQNESEEVVEAIRTKLGLNQPLHLRYASFLSGFLPVSLGESGLAWTGFDLGKSYVSDRPVVDAIADALPATVLLAVTAMGLAMALGLCIGFGLAMVSGGALDRWVLGIAAVGMSAPSFVMAILVSWLFGSVWHHWTGLPMTGGLWEVHPFEGPQLAWKHLILPALTLGVRPLAVVIQLTRNSAVDVLNMSFIRTARSKGISSFRLLVHHVVRNALNPVLTAASGWFASMLAGAVFVEYVFGWRGMGMLMFQALEQSDLPIVLGCVTVVAVTFISVNVVVDFAYGWLDPRVKLSNGH
ncbi:MAG: ABC transporter permease [Crocinitomicaceae bacterium]|nr:ABC transporter permease [Crocinitomicaceae bacterium]